VIRVLVVYHFLCNFLAKLFYMKTLIFTILLMATFQAYGQTGKEQTPIQYPLVQLLGVEYEVKNVPQPDNQRLLLIPYQELSSHRLPEVDLEIFDPVSNYTIVLYSDTKCLQNKH